MFGSRPPRLSPGSRPFVSDDEGGKWSVREQKAGEDPTRQCRRVGPTFARMMTAEAYRAWVAGEVKSFVYPPGEA